MCEPVAQPAPAAPRCPLCRPSWWWWGAAWPLRSCSSAGWCWRGRDYRWTAGCRGSWQASAAGGTPECSTFHACICKRGEGGEEWYCCPPKFNRLVQWPRWRLAPSSRAHIRPALLRPNELGGRSKAVRVGVSGRLWSSEPRPQSKLQRPVRAPDATTQARIVDARAQWRPR